MKIRHVVFLMLMGISISACSGSRAEMVKDESAPGVRIHEIAVFPFQTNRSESGSKIAAALTTSLEEAGFAVVPADVLRQRLDSAGISLQAAAADPRLAIGKLDKAVDAMVVGDASIRAMSGYIAHVAESSARMYDARSGRLIMEVKFVPPRRIAWQRATFEDHVGKALGEEFGKKL